MGNPSFSGSFNLSKLHPYNDDDGDDIDDAVADDDSDSICQNCTVLSNSEAKNYLKVSFSGRNNMLKHLKSERPWSLLIISHFLP